MAIEVLLQPKQLELGYLLNADGPDVATKLGYGGSRGGSKSGCARRLMLDRRMRLKGTTGFIVRRNFPDLYENHLVKFQEEFPEFSKYYNASHKEYVFPNRSRIAFRYADTTDQVRQISRGPEAMDIFIDQAEQFSEQELLWLQTPNRWPGSRPGQCKCVMFFNPGGPGTDYLRRVFWVKNFREGEKASDYAFIQAFGWDNYEWFRGEVPLNEKEFYALSHEERFRLFIEETSYGRKLNSLPEALRVGELLGSFDKFAGQYFAGVWDESQTVLPISIAERLIQPWWTRWIATDWGFAHYASTLWFAAGKIGPREGVLLGLELQRPVDVVIVYHELVVNETAEADLAEQIVENTPLNERSRIERYFLSPDAWAKRGSANTVAEQIGPVMRAGGMPGPVKADDDRVGGWRLLYDGFRRAGHVLRDDYSPEEDDYPCLFVSGACPQVVASVPLLVRNPEKMEDVLKVAGPLYDDVGDSLRYGYKSMMDPMVRAPREVRRRELYESIAQPDESLNDGEASETMTMAAMAVRKFDAQERKRYQRVRRR